MENEVIPMNDQPIAASFFGEGRWLTGFITPKASDIQQLFEQLTEGLDNATDRITACWKWVASMVKYVPFVRGKLIINGKTSVQDDFWASPSMTVHTKVGNCATKSFLLTSLLRNELSSDQVYCAMGNLYNGKPGGHAWVALKLPEGEQIMETTIPTAPPMVPANMATRYETVHYFNDASVYAVQGKTQLLPMAACYSTWLLDYLNLAYIKGQRIKLIS
jgi:hypothetical protein